MGPILFTVTLPDVGVRAIAGSGSSSTITHTEEFLQRPSPRLPRHGIRSAEMFGSGSLIFHAAVLAALLALTGERSVLTSVDPASQRTTQGEMPGLVFLAAPGPGGGGGGGGNRRPAPVPRAQAHGQDSITLPIAKPIALVTPPRDESPPPQVVALDAKPPASGLTSQVGVAESPLTFGTSQGLGSGGGVGEGIGTGIGSGLGPGLGPGSGGGTGGGVYRPGNGVIAPTLLVQVRPTYTADALRAKIQGSVLLELVVQRDGTPRDIRVIRSLDPEGLDREAILAVEQWRFGPGRRDGVAVDVLVTVVMDFHIH